METLLTGIGILLSAMFGTQQYQRWNDRRNGRSGGHEMVARALREEHAKTRRVLHEHNEKTTEAMTQFRTILGMMNKECSLKHQEIIGSIRK